MIQHLTRDQLDEVKYNNCISNAKNTCIYAYSWYLDIVCDSWDVLIKDDYVAVMPLPKRKKYGINYIYQIPWIQQLGVFSSDDIDGLRINEFVDSIPKKFKLIDVFFNSDNKFSSKHISVRNNYILPLNKPYEAIRRKFSKGRKSSIKQAQNSDITIIENYNHDEIIELFKQNKGAELHEKNLDYDVLSKLISYALSFNFAKSYAVINNSNELIGGAFFLIDAYRITYLFSAINNEGRTNNVMSYLLDHIIRTNAESEYILDFEGSMIKELASFFKSFGAVKEEYFWYKRRLFR
jgi:hypothetical protein